MLQSRVFVARAPSLTTQGCLVCLQIAIFDHCILIVDGGKQQHQRNLYIAEKYILVGYNSVPRSIFIRSKPFLLSKCAKSLEIPRKFEFIAVQGHPRSSILVLTESAYCICDFLLVINSNFRRISYRFRDIDV